MKPHQNPSPPPSADEPGLTALETQIIKNLITATKGKLAISVPEAAKLLSISKNNLYEQTRSCTGFPVIHLGSRTLVPIPGLVAWLVRNSSGEEASR